MSNSQSQTAGNPPRMRPIYFAIAGVVVLSAIGAGYAYSWTQAPVARGFTEADVAKVERSIQTEFARRNGLNVESVKMIKDSPAHLVGVAKIRTPSLGMVEKSCEANLSERGLPVWQCN
jgi:hypothetical protein